MYIANPISLFNTPMGKVSLFQTHYTLINTMLCLCTVSALDCSFLPNNIRYYIYTLPLSLLRDCLAKFRCSGFNWSRRWYSGSNDFDRVKFQRLYNSSPVLNTGNKGTKGMQLIESKESMCKYDGISRSRFRYLRFIIALFLRVLFIP